MTGPTLKQASIRQSLETEEVRKLRASRERAGMCGFEEEHLGVSFAEFRGYCVQHAPDDNAWKTMGRYLRDLGQQTHEGRGWLIGGPTGTGKTAILALIAEAECLRGGAWHEPETEAQLRGNEEKMPRAWKISVVDLADFFNQVGHGGEEWARQYGLYRRVRHLMIDDLGSEYLTGFGANALYKLIDERYTKKLPTHCTLNLQIDKLAEGTTHAKRIASRLFQCSFRMSLVGPDRRIPLSADVLAGIEF